MNEVHKMIAGRDAKDVIAKAAAAIQKGDTVVHIRAPGVSCKVTPRSMVDGRG